MTDLITPVVGFTGTRRPLTPTQVETLADLFIELRFTTLHHGDCVGADEIAHRLAEELLHARVEVHPPVDNRHRARCLPRWGVVHEPLPYLDRDDVIVDVSPVLVAAPKEFTELPVGGPRRGSGTWYTIRRARRLLRPLALVWLNGVVTYERWPGG